MGTDGSLNSKPKVGILTCTKNRHTCLERIVRFFLEQDYDDFVHLIYNNSCTEQRLNNNIDSKKIILINNCTDLETRLNYKTLGAIYRDALKFVPKDVDVINFADDDDIFLPNHITEGVKGLLKGGKTAYKPKYSFYKTKNVLRKLNNTLEPSIFVKKNHIEKYGFSDTSTPQHLQWLQPLIDEKDIYVDPNGTPTLIYDWSQDFPIYKTSGNPRHVDNFKHYEDFSIDVGDGIITPISAEHAKIFYKTNRK